MRIMPPLEENTKIWNEIYENNGGQMSYPDDALVRITHRLLAPSTHRKVLDYGFGSGSNMIHLLHKGYILAGVEASAAATRKLTERLAHLGLDADIRTITNGAIPFEADYFDAVIAWQVLYYNNWQTLREALAEIDRVLRPGGTFLGTMAAVGDYSHTHSVPVGDFVFRSAVLDQEGSTILIVDRDGLQRCFPGRSLTTGYFGFQFAERCSKHWVVSYQK